MEPNNNIGVESNNNQTTFNNNLNQDNTSVKPKKGKTGLVITILIILIVVGGLFSVALVKKPLPEQFADLVVAYISSYNDYARNNDASSVKIDATISLSDDFYQTTAQKKYFSNLKADLQLDVDIAKKDDLKSQVALNLVFDNDSNKKINALLKMKNNQIQITESNLGYDYYFNIPQDSFTQFLDIFYDTLQEQQDSFDLKSAELKEIKEEILAILTEEDFVLKEGETKTIKGKQAQIYKVAFSKAELEDLLTEEVFESLELINPQFIDYVNLNVFVVSGRIVGAELVADFEEVFNSADSSLTLSIWSTDLTELNFDFEADIRNFPFLIKAYTNDKSSIRIELGSEDLVIDLKSTAQRAGKFSTIDLKNSTDLSTLSSQQLGEIFAKLPVLSEMFLDIGQSVGDNIVNTTASPQNQSAGSVIEKSNELNSLGERCNVISEEGKILIAQETEEINKNLGEYANETTRITEVKVECDGFHYFTDSVEASAVNVLVTNELKTNVKNSLSESFVDILCGDMNALLMMQGGLRYYYTYRYNIGGNFYTLDPFVIDINSCQ